MENLINGGPFEFDPTEHEIVIGGIRVNSYGEDAKIEIEFSDLRTLTEGIDGDCSYNERTTITGNFKVRVLANSPMAYLLEKMTVKKKGRYPLLYGVKSLGGAGYYTQKAAFKKIPSKKITRDVQTLEFELIAPQMTLVK